MSNADMSSIFEQINNLKKPDSEVRDEKLDIIRADLQELLTGVSEEIQRVLEENNLTQDDLCKLTGMSQSNISKIQNGKVAPRLETLQKIAQATHTKLVICFENVEGDEQ